MIRTLCSVTAMTLLLAGCGVFGERSTPSFYDVLQGEAGQNGRACVRQSNIRSYGVLERDVVSINAGRRYYLATMLPGCNALSTSPRAQFEGRFSEVCGSGRSKVRIAGEECTIRQIFEFDNREKAFEVHKNALETHRELREKAK